MPCKNVTEFLDSQNAKYMVMSHSPAYTAPEIAHTAHISGKHFAKSVMVNMDDKLTMVVLPANENVDLHELCDQAHCNKITLATEREFKQTFDDCEVGAMPPFGSLYNLDVYVSPHFHDDDEIAFNAGTHSELIQMRFSDYCELEHPKKLND